MMVELLMLLLFAAVNHGDCDTEVRCDARQGQRSQCSVGLGGTAFIQLMANASGLKSVKWRKNHSGDLSLVFTVKKDKVTIEEAGFRNRTWFFVLNGTFQLRQAERSDAGEYFLEAFQTDGLLHSKTRLQLSVTEHDTRSFPLILVLGGSASAAVVLIVVVVVTTCICRKKNVHPDSGQQLNPMK